MCTVLYYREYATSPMCFYESCTVLRGEYDPPPPVLMKVVLYCREYDPPPVLMKVVLYCREYDLPLPRTDVHWSLLHEESPKNNQIFRKNILDIINRNIRCDTLSKFLKNILYHKITKQVNPLYLELLNQAIATFPWFYRVHQSKFEANQSRGS